MCSDDEESSKYSCTCTQRYFGERCEDDRCDIYQCQNNGTCFVALLNDIPTPGCECPKNYGGATCNLDLCLDIECGNGTCIRGDCQCDEGINCGTGGHCSQGICNCDAGFSNVANICVDLCEGVNCGIGSDCSGGICSCRKGYVKMNNICVQTCILTPCQASD